jgi:hypothetical protein
VQDPYWAEEVLAKETLVVHWFILTIQKRLMCRLPQCKVKEKLKFKTASYQNSFLFFDLLSACLPVCLSVCEYVLTYLPTCLSLANAYFCY